MVTTLLSASPSPRTWDCTVSIGDSIVMATVVVTSVCQYTDKSGISYTFKGGLVRLSESAFTWSTMVNTSCSEEKCSRKAHMRL